MRVQVVEVSPRDGLQNEPRILSTASKVELIRRCVDAGARRIEAVSFVRPDRVRQMADAEAVMAGVPRRADVSYIGLVLNRRGLDRAIATGVDEVNCVVVTTETFSRRNQGASVDEMVQAWADIAKAAHAAGLRASVTVAAAFGCPFEGEVSPTTVGNLVRRLVAGEPDEIALADTIGVGVPTQVRDVVAEVTSAAPGVPLRAHFHDTRNTAVANAIAAIESGVGVLDASVGGIGGCPFAPAATGNVATEDLIYALHRSGHVTGLNPARVMETAAWIGDELGKASLPGSLVRAGWFPADRAAGCLPDDRHRLTGQHRQRLSSADASQAAASTTGSAQPTARTGHS